MNCSAWTSGCRCALILATALAVAGCGVFRRNTEQLREHLAQHIDDFSRFATMWKEDWTREPFPGQIYYKKGDYHDGTPMDRDHARRYVRLMQECEAWMVRGDDRVLVFYMRGTKLRKYHILPNLDFDYSGYLYFFDTEQMRDWYERWSRVENRMCVLEPTGFDRWWALHCRDGVVPWGLLWRAGERMDDGQASRDAR
ncbi:MAG: hypothetical protein Kow0062_23050 [Acidobacteriota bacterium]